MRDMHLLPKRGDKPEWQHSQDYWAEKDQFSGDRSGRCGVRVWLSGCVMTEKPSAPSDVAPAKAGAHNHRCLSLSSIVAPAFVPQ